MTAYGAAVVILGGYLIWSLRTLKERSRGVRRKDDVRGGGPG
ncbi:MAG TPA: hypothetical protein VFD88_01640 [Clostridia bacterium]|nr:hypothetical protein [Clostridia bacterium]